jgi:hypothetical protein
MATRRAPRATSKRAAPVSPGEIELGLRELRERLRAEGAVKIASILPKGAQAELRARLSAEGYEVAGTWLRRPVNEQIRDALGHGAALTKKALASVVRGVSGPELTRVVSELEKGGELYRVLRGKSETFTGSGAAVLATPSLAALKPVIAQLSRALAAVSKKKGMTLLASDVDDWLAEARGVLDRNAPGGKPVPPPSSGPAGGSASLLDALDATRDERTGLSFVPRVVERLLPSVSLAVAHEMLLQAARDERIELRPEGGLARLTGAELGLCPAGPGGMRLSWARRLDGAA